MVKKLLFGVLYLELCALVFTIIFFAYPQTSKPKVSSTKNEILFDELSDEELNSQTDQSALENVLGIQDQLISTINSSTTPLDLSTVTLNKDEFLKQLQFNKAKNILLVKPSLSKGNYFLTFDNNKNFKLPDEQMGNLNKIKALIDWNEKSVGVGENIGISFAKGEALDLMQFHSAIRDRKIDSVNLEEDINVEINRVMFDLSSNKVLLGISNSFTENAWSAGDSSVMLDPEVAILKLQTAKKASTLFIGINYITQLYKHKNIDVAINESLALYPEIQSEIDMLKFIGLDSGTSKVSKDFVLGEAIIGEKHVKIIGGGVCAAASFLNASIELGLRAYHINYDREIRNSHTDTRYRYRMATTHPDAIKNPDRFDVTVFYDAAKPKNTMTARLKIEDGKRVKMTVHRLILQINKDPGRSMYIFEVEPVR